MIKNFLIILLSFLLISCQSPQTKKNLDQKIKSLNLKVKTKAEVKAKK